MYVRKCMYIMGITMEMCINIQRLIFETNTIWEGVFIAKIFSFYYI